MVATINDENIAPVAQGDPVRRVEFTVIRPGQAPIRDIRPFGIEHLQTAIIFISHVDTSIFSRSDTGRRIQLPICVARTTQFGNKFSG